MLYYVLLPQVASTGTVSSILNVVPETFAAAAGATMPSSRSNVILPETPRPPSAAGNGGGNEQLDIIQKMLAHQDRAEARREREEERRDRTTKAIVSQLMNTNEAVKEIKTEQAEIKAQVGKNTQQLGEYAKSAKKGEKAAKCLQSLGLLSPDSDDGRVGK